LYLSGRCLKLYIWYLPILFVSGNGRLRHAGVFTDWSASSFMDDLALDRYFTLKDGILTVKLGGLYYFYAQVIEKQVLLGNPRYLGSQIFA